MNKNVTFLFIVKNISCVQFSSCHTSDENFLTSNFSQTTVYHYSDDDNYITESIEWSPSKMDTTEDIKTCGLFIDFILLM